MIDFKNGAIFKLKESTSPTTFEVMGIMIEGEEIIGAYQGVRDYVVFTTKRVFAVNVKGITGKQRDYTSIPYSQVQSFSITTAGLMDSDCEMDLWIPELGQVHFEFSCKVNITAIGKSISERIL